MGKSNIMETPLPPSSAFYLRGGVRLQKISKKGKCQISYNNRGVAKWEIGGMSDFLAVLSTKLITLLIS